MFPQIHTEQGFLLKVQHIPEIKKINQEVNDEQISIYHYSIIGPNTFDTPESKECRGIVFNSKGEIICRPFHKFFNVGERASKEEIGGWDICGISEKLDGSMITPVLINDKIYWKTKKSFFSEVAMKVTDFIYGSEHYIPYNDFAKEVIRKGYTPIFEYMGPNNRIVISYLLDSLVLIGLRHMITGEYIPLDSNFTKNRLLDSDLVIPKNRLIPLNEPIDQLITKCNQISHFEGWIIHRSDGEMVKIKTEWYVSLHRKVTFLREKDIAMSCLNEDVDDLIGYLVEIGDPQLIQKVKEIQLQVFNDLLSLEEEINNIVNQDKNLDKKTFAIKYKNHPLFYLLINKYLNRDCCLEIKKHYLRRQMHKFSDRHI